MIKLLLAALVVACGLVVEVGVAGAQPLGRFQWQLQPYCNVVEVEVTQLGSQYRVEGFDDQCDASQRAPVTGFVTPNPDGTFGFGLTIVTVPGGVPVHVDARISLATLSGPWSDSAGHTGTFGFNASTGGAPRPAPVMEGSGDITAVTAGSGLTGGGANGDVSLAVDPTLVQSRVTTACPAGQALRSISQNGTALCEPITGSAGGDITSVVAGTGLFGGGQDGDVTLGIDFRGSGSAPTAARSDHSHAVGAATTVGVGPQALVSNGVTAVQNTALGARALTANTSGDSNTAVGYDALEANQSGVGNVAVGAFALQTTSGGFNTALGYAAGNTFATNTRTTLLGSVTEVGGNGLTNATAVGANALVGQSNSLVLGSINGVNEATSDVNVGIGTTTPQARLEIANDDVDDTLVLRAAGGLSVAPDLTGRKSSGTLAAPTAVPTNNALLVLRGDGHDGSAFAFGSAILLRSAEAWSPTAHGSEIQFNTVANGTTAPDTRMTIASAGNVGIGTTGPIDRLHVSGEIRVQNCVRNANATQIAGACPSDARFKRDVTAFPQVLDKVSALRPVHYFWRAQEFAGRGFGAEQTYGLIAQDVEAVLPDLVRTMDDGYKSVDYSKLPLYLLQAIRELKDANDALTARNTALEQQALDVTSRLTAIESTMAAAIGARK